MYWRIIHGLYHIFVVVYGHQATIHDSKQMKKQHSTAKQMKTIILFFKLHLGEKHVDNKLHSCFNAIQFTFPIFLTNTRLTLCYLYPIFRTSPIHGQRCFTITRYSLQIHSQSCFTCSIRLKDIRFMKRLLFD